MLIFRSQDILVRAAKYFPGLALNVSIPLGWMCLSLLPFGPVLHTRRNEHRLSFRGRIGDVAPSNSAVPLPLPAGFGRRLALGAAAALSGFADSFFFVSQWCLFRAHFCLLCRVLLAEFKNQILLHQILLRHFLMTLVDFIGLVLHVFHCSMVVC
jgi:hypothetical protein